MLNVSVLPSDTLRLTAEDKSPSIFNYTVSNFSNVSHIICVKLNMLTIKYTASFNKKKYISNTNQLFSYESILIKKPKLSLIIYIG